MGQVPHARRQPEAAAAVARDGVPATATQATTFKEALKPKQKDPKLELLEQLKEQQRQLQRQQQQLQQQLSVDNEPSEGIPTGEAKKKKNKKKKTSPMNKTHLPKTK